MDVAPINPGNKEVSVDGTHQVGNTGKTLFSLGSVFGAVAASSCCILPLVLFSLGAGGAWIGNLTALAPYQPYFVAFTVVCLGGGFYFVYRKPKLEACGPDGTCGTPSSNRVAKTALWMASILVVAAVAFNYVAPVLLDI
jgi:mercuric ion transport protein